jgi:hypothetical protein
MRGAGRPGGTSRPPAALAVSAPVLLFGQGLAPRPPPPGGAGEQRGALDAQPVQVVRAGEPAGAQVYVGQAQAGHVRAADGQQPRPPALLAWPGRQPLPAPRKLLFLLLKGGEWHWGASEDGGGGEVGVIQVDRGVAQSQVNARREPRLPRTHRSRCYGKLRTRMKYRTIQDKLPCEQRPDSPGTLETDPVE